jgi:Leucine-rich repeat (LRR) protein
LRVLVLNHNNLESLPPEIEQLQNLESIYLGGNPRLDFAAVLRLLGHLPKLVGLGLDDNRLTSVPKEIALLQHLKTLGLSANRLRALPSELAKLSALESLDLYHNAIADLPEELTRLEHLKRLFLKDTPLTRQLESVQRRLPRVTLSLDVPPELYLTM